MNSLYFLDLMVFLFLIQYLFYFSVSNLYTLVKSFLHPLKEVFGLNNKYLLSSFISSVIFLILLTLCFFGYFSYSFCFCGLIEFTLFFSLLAWLSTFFSFITSESFSIYMSKGGDTYLKTLSLFLVELVSEFSRPIALTVRLTVNIMVGHLISLMLYQLLELNLGKFYLWFFVLAILMECFVFFIQSYIFSRLIFLYLNE